MSHTLKEYKGYIGSIEHDLEDGILYGKILFINDLVNYEGSTLPELQASFEAAVEDYLSLCADLGAEPNKPMTGSFNVRIGAENHRRLAMEAAKRGEKINALVKTAVEQFLAGSHLRLVTYNVVRVETVREIENSFGQAESSWQTETQKPNRLITHLN